MKKTFKISKEIKDQILERVREGSSSVPKIAKEHGISPNTVYSWLSRTIKAQPSWREYSSLQRQNKELLALAGELTIKLSQAKKKI